MYLFTSFGTTLIQTFNLGSSQGWQPAEETSSDLELDNKTE